MSCFCVGLIPLETHCLYTPNQEVILVSLAIDYIYIHEEKWKRRNFHIRSPCGDFRGMYARFFSFSFTYTYTSWTSAPAAFLLHYYLSLCVYTRTTTVHTKKKRAEEFIESKEIYKGGKKLIVGTIYFCWIAARARQAYIQLWWPANLRLKTRGIYAAETKREKINFEIS